MEASQKKEVEKINEVEEKANVKAEPGPKPKYSRGNPPPPPDKPRPLKIVVRNNSKAKVIVEAKSPPSTSIRGRSESRSQRKFSTAPIDLLSKDKVHPPVQPMLYPPHTLTWKVVGRTGYAMPVLMPHKDVGVSGRLVVEVKEAHGIMIRKSVEVGIDITIGERRGFRLKKKTKRAKLDKKEGRVVWNTEVLIPLTHNDRTLRLRINTYKIKGMLKNKTEIGRVKIPISMLIVLLYPNLETSMNSPSVVRRTLQRTTMSDLRRQSLQISSNRYQAWFDMSSHHYGQTLGKLLLGFRLIPDPGAKIKCFRTPVAESEEKKIAKGNMHKQFGVPLKAVIERSRYEYPEVCFHVVEYLRETQALKEPGIFRKEGRESSIKKIVKDFNEGKTARFISPHDAAGTLKLFFRSLPEPLIPSLQLVTFVEAEKSENLEQKIQKYKVIMATLPECNRSVLRFLMEFLHDVHLLSNENKMEAKNLATCWTPSLMFHNAEKSKGPISLETLRAMSGPEARCCVETLIKHHEAIFYAAEDEEAKSPLSSFRAKSADTMQTASEDGKSRHSSKSFDASPEGYSTTTM
mmetsp:Transcript_17673/g.26480  ORF Transcript_17673/g.26480 Transcript_17673/m.26480 type:complete len:575 (+) Transcript_17673:100-1824(+)